MVKQRFTLKLEWREVEMVGWLGKKSLNENNIFFNIAIYTMLLDNFFTLKCEVNKGMAQSGNGWMVRKTAGMARDKKKECWERDGGDKHL